MTIRALIVDDELLARERIRTLLAEDREIETIGECRNGTDAIEAIRKRAPDLVFLDVQMPERDGFDVLRAFDPEELPAIVFVTAHDKYALKAFDFFALDYLLKPFHRDRFFLALERAKETLGADDPESLKRQLRELLQGLKNEYLQRLIVKDAGRIFFIKTDEIDWVEAAGNYVQIHCGPASHLLRQTLKSLEESLNPADFLRVNRSAIVNLESIRELAPLFHGECRVVLKNGVELTSSRNIQRKLERLVR